MRLLFFVSGLVFLCHMMSGQTPDFETPVDSGALAFLQPVIGDWYPVPDPDMLKKNPDMANTIAFRFQWANSSHTVLHFFEGVPNENHEDAVLTCQIVANPRSGEVLFQGYQSRNNFFYEGRYEPLSEGDGFARIYDVHYPEGTQFRLESDRKKGYKTYREVCRLVAENSMTCTIEQLEAGFWIPWGQGTPWKLERR